ncbi:GDSL family lipase [Methylobacterium sp. W2]|uniref:GDSL-type esterase/lipase family protein n=1 Tax=Methylobacterium sp. W2 TaxID=2598107 RepID=UPI001D0BF598|nr:GDSL-type esterase/lipase family protein [Methylobacterium sp. W2]MCC0806946.1 GDSL family lipase [Methylobacterium sp. W2]
MRICFIGDSFVNGVGDDTCLGWTGRLCAEARRAGWDVTHYNLGIRRDTSLDIHERWRREAEARLPEGLDGRLVFAFGANDCTFMDGRTRVPHDRCLDTVRAILADAAGWRKTLMIGPLPVCDDPSTDARILALSNDMAPICARLGVPFLPVFDVARGSDAWAREAAAGDGTHPNAGGYAALASVVAEWEAWRAWF